MKKPSLCLNFSPKKLYFTKNSLYEKPTFSKEPARACKHAMKNNVQNQMQNANIHHFASKNIDMITCVMSCDCVQVIFLFVHVIVTYE